MSTESLPHKQNKDEVYEWIRLYQETGEEEVQVKLVKHYEALVRSLARKFSKGREYDEDLYQVGMVGLLAALTRFDSEFGRSFESFAVPTIVGEIKRFIRDKTWSVHVPRRIKELGPKIKKAVESLTVELNRSPLVHEIAAYLEVSEEEVLETMEMSKSYQALSVDRSLEADQEGGEVTLLDLVGNEDSGFEKTDQKMLLQKAFQVLNEREKQILMLTYYDNLSQKETGEKLGISQMHVSRLQRRALQKLRDSIKVEPSEIL
ncbi:MULTISPECIES: RNA polymerase sigma factor SigB [Alkalihalophilus]|jgi:RNA polymerase sigma-B factor|uniref:RNA polymerase sigma factor SigB n=3 Tax=Alkalihalophilus TaxID=2893060 RepID=D3FRY7_ALKPO|nr:MULTISPECIES: RNA polymerase sigma factor SigB [Alkalihalophilus]ADC49897.1 RNA polymerase sigma factor SigB [Alkalihalophilus pseudofirmus OF4]ERN52630.1 RNA polymerase sigma factor SigB [Alkalihalophilus marmarensis DSM 21297]MCM3491668.1 RNA polymerase sigma factor SigB [Alkalihalophilus marmarensis]MDV2887122.1 RNA polymerase sigma factor SigB [Alkalihalophilus pseudofirmus]MEC2071885.1 RNA polymerase sigma factor SigB [Alkalihalophilus marmarensis]